MSPEEEKKEKLYYWYRKHLLPLNPDNNEGQDMSMIIQLFLYKQVFPIKEESFSMIRMKYEEYLKFWHLKYKNRKYLTKEEKLMSISAFLSSGKWRNSFDAIVDSRFDYLFGKLSKAQIKTYHERFKNIISGIRKSSSTGS